MGDALMQRLRAWLREEHSDITRAILSTVMSFAISLILFLAADAAFAQPNAAPPLAASIKLHSLVVGPTGHCNKPREAVDRLGRGRSLRVAVVLVVEDCSAAV